MSRPVTHGGNLSDFSSITPQLEVTTLDALLMVQDKRTRRKPGSSSLAPPHRWNAVLKMVLVSVEYCFPGVSKGQESACSVGDLGLMPGLGRSPGEGNGYSLQYSGLENSMDRGAWWATVQGVTANTSAFHFHLCCPLLLPKVSNTIHGSCEAHKTKAKQQWELQNLIPMLWLRFKTIVGFLTSFPARIPLASGHAPWVLWSAPHTWSPFNLKDSVSLLHPFYRWENWGT